MLKKWAFAALLLSAQPLLAAEAQHAPAAGNPQATAAAILNNLMQDNGRFVAEHDTAHFTAIRDGQHPRATVVACADSRVHMQALDASPEGDLFVVRNIGNQIDNNEGSVEYGIRHLNTPLLLVLGHVGCGAVAAAMGDYGKESPAIRRELDGLHLSIEKTGAQGSRERQWLANVVGNVHQQVNYALQEYAQEVQAGRLAVVGAVYDFRNDLGKGAGRMVIVNVNGETDPARIARSPLVRAAGQSNPY